MKKIKPTWKMFSEQLFLFQEDDPYYYSRLHDYNKDTVRNLDGVGMIFTLMFIQFAALYVYTEMFTKKKLV